MGAAGTWEPSCLSFSACPCSDCKFSESRGGMKQPRCFRNFTVSSATHAALRRCAKWRCTRGLHSGHSNRPRPYLFTRRSDRCTAPPRPEDHRCAARRYHSRARTHLEELVWSRTGRRAPSWVKVRRRPNSEPPDQKKSKCSLLCTPKQQLTREKRIATPPASLLTGDILPPRTDLLVQYILPSALVMKPATCSSSSKWAR